MLWVPPIGLLENIHSSDLLQSLHCHQKAGTWTSPWLHISSSSFRKIISGFIIVTIILVICMTISELLIVLSAFKSKEYIWNQVIITHLANQFFNEWNLLFLFLQMIGIGHFTMKEHIQYYKIYQGNSNFFVVSFENMIPNWERQHQLIILINSTHFWIVLFNQIRIFNPYVISMVFPFHFNLFCTICSWKLFECSLFSE